jgi:hypothetical protein
MHNLPAWAEMIVIFSHFFLFLRTKSGCGALRPRKCCKTSPWSGYVIGKIVKCNHPNPLHHRRRAAARAGDHHGTTVYSRPDVANLETAITALGLVLQGTLLNDDKVLAETIVNAMFDGGFVNSVVLLDPMARCCSRRCSTPHSKMFQAGSLSYRHATGQD